MNAIPGPWRLEGNWSERHIEFEYTDNNGNRHSGNIGVIDGMRGEQNEANARLAAAAPELLAALKHMTMHRKMQIEMAGLSEIPLDIQLADIAIAKAEGR